MGPQECYETHVFLGSGTGTDPCTVCGICSGLFIVHLNHIGESINYEVYPTLYSLSTIYFVSLQKWISCLFQSILLEIWKEQSNGAIRLGRVWSN